jgi:hypothetical protein
MTVRKGLKSLAESTPNFSNQALENAINELKIGWVTKSIQLDTSITDNTVLSTTQKNDVKETINNIAYLNTGRYLNDLVRHTTTILDGSIIPGDPAITGTEDTGQGDFLEILQSVQSLQTLIPNLYGQTAEEKARGVDDHLGVLNNIFIRTDDSSKPVFTSLRESIVFINNGNLATETALATAIDNLSAFLSSVVGDSTDFQQTLNTFATAVATANTNLDTTLQSVPYDVKRTQMINDRDTIVTQQALEISNITSIRTFIESLTDNSAYIGLAEDPQLRKLMAKVAQNTNWQSYFNDYEKNQNDLNPQFDIDSDSDKSAVIDQILISRGLPDVTSPVDIEDVAEKAKKDDRIDTRDFDYYTVEQIIKNCCEQLQLRTIGTIYDQSSRLLTNLNERDRQLIANELDANESAGTIS